MQFCHMRVLRPHIGTGRVKANRTGRKKSDMAVPGRAESVAFAVSFYHSQGAPARARGLGQIDSSAFENHNVDVQHSSPQVRPSEVIAWRLHLWLGSKLLIPARR
jgi:hypothetical protein